MLTKINIYTLFFIFSTASLFAQETKKKTNTKETSNSVSSIQATQPIPVKFIGQNGTFAEIIATYDQSGNEYGVLDLTSALDDPADSDHIKFKLWKDNSKALNYGGDFKVDGRLTTSNFKMTSGAGSGKVLTSSSVGTASWQTPSGGSSGSIDGLSDGKNTLNSESVYLGLGAGVNDDSYNGNTNPSYNTGVGISALNKNGTAASFFGEKNTAVGFEALKNLDNNNGDNNVAIGYQAHLNNDDGHENTALGSQAMLNYSGGFGNTVVGYQALKGSASGRLGNYNTVIGHNALPDLTTTSTSSDQGSFNVVIGYEAAKGHTNIKEELFIQNHKTSGSSPADPLIWGDFNFRKVQLFVRNHSTTNKFWVNNSAGGTSSWSSSSDRRLKKNISTIPNALEKIQKLRGVNFEWKKPEIHRKGLQMGFIAQEALDFIPEVVDEKSEFMSMEYAPITALLVEAMKEQQKIIEELKKQNYGLEKRLTSIENNMHNRNVKTVSK